MTLLYPKGVHWPGPQDKLGYSGYQGLQPKEGFVLHSMEGSWLAAAGELAKASRQASWQFSVLKDGRVYQHYDPRVVAWHCGLPGDADPWTAAIGNVALIGIEHEGVAGEPLTYPQLAATIDLQRWCYSVLPTLKKPALRQSHFEHGWLSSTACPSGRIPWDQVLSALTRQEDDMVIIIAKQSAPGDKYVLYPGIGKVHMRFPELKAITGAYGAPAAPHVSMVMPDADFNQIETIPDEFWKTGGLALLPAKVDVTLKTQ